jgi:hypothetical protein
LTIEDLTAEGLPGRSQLDQVVMTLARNINAMRNQAGDTIHDMKSRAGLECSCRKCAQKAVHAFAGAHEDETGFEKGPF